MCWDQRIFIPDYDDTPEVVTSVSRMKQDVFALKTLIGEEVY